MLTLPHSHILTSRLSSKGLSVIGYRLKGMQLGLQKSELLVQTTSFSAKRIFFLNTKNVQNLVKYDNRFYTFNITN